jgi:putative peptide zinc metalloprotease protein
MLTALLKRGRVPYVAAGVVLLLGVSGVAVAAETGTFSSTPASTPAPSVAAAPSTDTGQLAGFPAAGGGNNIVQVINHADGHFRMDGKVKVNQIPGPNAGPKNVAFAYSSCTDCQTMAVALEINLIGTNARNIQPLNEAVAVNYRCTRCVTYARAIQYDIQVDDPNQVRSDVRDLTRQMDAALKHIKSSHETFLQALDEVNAVVAEFNGLSAYLTDRHDTATDPMTPGASPLPAASDSPSDSATPTVSGAPVESPSPSPSPSPQATPSTSP